MIESSLALISFWLTGLTLITTLMLSPSTPPVSLLDSISLLMDLARDPALPGLAKKLIKN